MSTDPKTAAQHNAEITGACEVNVIDQPALAILQHAVSDLRALLTTAEKQRDFYMAETHRWKAALNQVDAKCKALVDAIPYPGLKHGAGKCIVYYLRQGQDNGGITRDSLASWLECVNESLAKFIEATKL